MKRLHSITTNWFFKDIPSMLKFSTIFIRGDMLALLPLLIFIGILGFFSVKFMVIMFGVYFALRHLGEMIYWLLQQFGPRTYRPDDFGFKNLDNHAIYILYQTLANVWAVVGVGIVIAAFMFMK